MLLYKKIYISITNLRNKKTRMYITLYTKPFYKFLFEMTYDIQMLWFKSTDHTIV